MPELRRIVFNPADHSQGYKLWSHGFIEPIGSAPIPDAPFPDDWASSNPVVDINVVNWAEPSGYTLTHDGEIRGFGAVVDPGVHGHAPTVNFNIWKRMFMNPNGDGSGYMVAFNGTYNRWGPTAPVLPVAVPATLPGPLPDYGRDHLRDMKLDWATKKWVILTKSGEMHASFSIAGYTTTVPVNPYDWDVFRALIVRDWNTSTPKILVGSGAAWFYSVNSWGSFSGQPVNWYGRDNLKDMYLIHDGSGGQPMEIAIASWQGGVWRWFVSSPPTTTWIEPANSSTVTTTTRPTIRVGWIDPDGNSVVTTDARVYGPNLGSISDPDQAGTEPKFRWLNLPTQTGYVPDKDLENGTWQGFFKVTDTSGASSSWAKSTWTQNVTKPAAPTLSAPSIIGRTVRMTVSAATNATQFIYVEYSDDGVTWFPVRGANPGPSVLSTGVFVYDYEAPFFTERQYRARISSLNPALSSVWSATTTVELPGEVWSLLNVASNTELLLAVEPGSVRKPEKSGAASFTPLVGTENIVLSGGWMEGDLSLTVRTLSKAARRELQEFLRAGAVMLLRNPFGDHWFVKWTGDSEREYLRAIPLLSEQTPLRDANLFGITLSVVARPDA
jgi:hypothetical protein